MSKKESIIIQGLPPNLRFKAESASGGKMFREISPVFWNAFGVGPKGFLLDFNFGFCGFLDGFFNLDLCRQTFWNLGLNFCKIEALFAD